MADPYAGLQPNFASRLRAFIEASGGRVMPGSGFRTIEEQTDLYNRWKAGTYNVPSVARPGKSKHNHGLAMDLRYGPGGLEWAQANAARFGLHFPVRGENWHVEMIGAEEGGQAAPGVAGPGDSLESRLESIMSIVGASPASQPAEASFSTPPAPAPVATMAPPGEAAAGGQWAGGVPPPGYEPPGKGVERWADVARAALRYTGQSESWLPLLLRRMNQESGGNPRVVNRWDSNWKRGDPSIGLMQNIGSAFPERARELADRGVTDGFANIVASIRYTLARYGSLQAWAKRGGY